MSLLRERNIALVIADRPEIRSFQTHELTADFAFVRFHHGSRGVRGNYSDRELDEWAERVRNWADRGDVFAYFNNDWEGFAIRNALRVEGAARIKIPRCSRSPRRTDARSLSVRAATRTAYRCSRSQAPPAPA